MTSLDNFQQQVSLLSTTSAHVFVVNLVEGIYKDFFDPAAQGAFDVLAHYVKQTKTQENLSLPQKRELYDIGFYQGMGYFDALISTHSSIAERFQQDVNRYRARVDFFKELDANPMRLVGASHSRTSAALEELAGSMEPNVALHKQLSRNLSIQKEIFRMYGESLFDVSFHQGNEQ